MRTNILVVLSVVCLQIATYECGEACAPYWAPLYGCISFDTLSVNGKYPEGTIGNISCKPGYMNTGRKVVTCERYKIDTFDYVFHWIGHGNGRPNCREIPSCSPLSLSNGIVSYSTSPVNEKYLENTTAEYICNSGYSRSGPRFRTCQKSQQYTGSVGNAHYYITVGKWSAQAAVCKKESSSSSSSCFPSVVKVKVENGNSVKMSELQIGDKVQTVTSIGEVTYSEVKSFLMKQNSVISVYKSITTSSNDTIILSDTHLIYARKSIAEKFNPVYGNNVVNGDEVLIERNNKLTSATVIKTKKLKMQGAYVPLTKDGNLIVDGVASSCYASFDHDSAHLAMTLLQWFPSIIEWIFNGSPDYVDMAKELGRRILPHSLLYKNSLD